MPAHLDAERGPGAVLGLRQLGGVGQGQDLGDGMPDLRHGLGHELDLAHMPGVVCGHAHVLQARR
jgi:hypothetical protein